MLHTTLLCAWILWSMNIPTTPPFDPVYSNFEGYDTRAECQKKVDLLYEKLGDAKPGWRHPRYFCLPDTVKPQ